jgi:hypothetical protein
MAEEQEIEVSNEEDSGSKETPQAQSNPSEEKASALGWMPKEDWVADGRDAEDWKPAKVFLEHGDMIGKIRATSRELEETKRALQFTHDKNKEVYAKGYQAAITELRAAKRAALAEGDLVKADEIDEKIDATKDELTKVVNTPAPKVTAKADPEHEAWLARNPWYSEGRMQKFADAIAIEYINSNQGQVTPNQVRDFVETEVKKEFAHKFPSKTKGAPNPDGEGRVTRKTQSTGLDPKLAQAKASMTDEQRGIMKTMLKSTGMSEEKYLKLYAS